MNTSPVTRPSLLLRIRDTTNDQAWREFVEIYTPLLFAYCQRAGLQPTDAADIAQDVLRIIAAGAADFEYDPARGTFRGWLLGVARNRLRKFHAHQLRYTSSESPTTVERALESNAGGHEESDWDQAYHQRLFEWAASQVQKEFEDRTWQAFWQTAVEDKSGREVAAALGLSVGAVYIARSRVLSRLKQRASEAMKGFGVSEEPE